MITISNINSKWDEIKSKLSSDTVKMATENGFLESAENWEDLKDYFDDEAKELLNKFIDRVNRELGEKEKTVKPKKAQKENNPFLKKWFEITTTPKASPQSKYFYCSKVDKDGRLTGKTYDENGNVVLEKTGIPTHNYNLIRELAGKPAFNKKTPKTKKLFEGEYVEILSPEITFIKRYANLDGKTISSVKDRVRTLLASLQKAIIDKKIRKTSVYAETIMNIQSNLIKILNTPGSTTINIVNKDGLKDLYGKFAVMPNARIIKSYLSIQGKGNVKEKAKALLKRIEKSTDTSGRFTTEMSDIKRSLEHYIDGNTDSPEISSQTLAGLYGLAGVSKKKIVSGNALGSIDFLATNFKTLPFTGKWKELIGQPSEPFKIMIYGKAGSGKSSCSLQFAQYLAELGKKVLYVADEEKFGYTLQEKMKRFKIAHRNLSIIDKMPSNTSEFDIVFVDSINSIGYEPEDLRKLDKGQSWVYVFQATKEGNFRGSQEFEHDVDTSIVVEDMKAHSVKNRFGGKGEISI